MIDPTIPIQKRYVLNSTLYQYGIAKNITITLTTIYEEKEIVEASKTFPCFFDLSDIYFVKIPFAVNETGVRTPKTTGIHTGSK